MRIRHVPLRALGPYERPFRGFASLGTASQYQSKDCPVGGSWESWCDCVYTPGSDLNTRCRSKPLGPAMFTPPWTEVGAGARGLPKPDSIIANITSAGLQIASNLTGGIVPGPPQGVVQALPAVQPASTQTVTDVVAKAPEKEAEASIFGVPKTMAFVGGMVLLLGAGALALSKR